MNVNSILKRIFPIENGAAFNGFIPGLTHSALLGIMKWLSTFSPDWLRSVIEKLFPLLYFCVAVIVLIVFHRQKSIGYERFSPGWYALGVITTGVIFIIAETATDALSIPPSAFFVVGALILIFEFCYQLSRNEKNN